MQEKLKELIRFYLEEKKPQARFSLFREINKNAEFVEFLHNNYNFIDFHEKIDRFAYHFYYNINEIPKCEICNKELKYNSFSSGYPNVCSSKCKTTKFWKDGNLNSETSKKSTNTWLERYSGENHKVVDNKKKETYKSKYGIDHWLKSEECKEQNKKNIFEKCGVDNYAKLESSKIKIGEKIKNKSLEWKNDRYLKYKKSIKSKYGVDNVFQIVEVKNKIITNNQEKYGVDYLFSSDIIRDKSKQTMVNKYGVENPMQNMEIQERHFKSCVQYSEFEYENKIFKLQGDEKIAIKDLIKKYLQSEIVNQFVCPIFEYSYEGRTHKYRPDFFIENDNKIIEVKSIWTFFKDYKRIYKKSESVLNSGYEYEIWLYTHQKDLFLIDFNKGFYDKINVNGLLNNKLIFYSSNFLIFPENKLILTIINKTDKNNFYQKLKYNLSLKNNQKYDLICVFSDLIEEKINIVESRLKNKLGLIKNKIYGRQTKVVQISSKTAKKFLQTNHIQGFIKSSIYLALKYNNEIVSVMTFNKPRVFTKKTNIYYIEMGRFCSKLDSIVIGGADKMLKYFIKNFNDNYSYILSYADHNWSNGNLYEKLNFKFQHISRPNYYIVKDNKRYHRYSFRKDKLVSMGYDPNMTESEILNSIGLDKLYDCGSIVYHMELQRNY